MTNQNILLMRDNPKDEMLTLRLLKKHHMVNEIVVVRDGSEALDYLYATGCLTSDLMGQKRVKS